PLRLRRSRISSSGPEEEPFAAFPGQICKTLPKTVHELTPPSGNRMALARGRARLLRREAEGSARKPGGDPATLPGRAGGRRADGMRRAPVQAGARKPGAAAGKSLRRQSPLIGRALSLGARARPPIP